ncbi:50S ribosomal protein L24e [Candidatus Woesearchaeota archaeon]|nr:50S ribosomal protein L24e [Candidatus Woesearchaeota archaeon]
MVNCSFCGREIERGTGKMFVKNDGKILYFCSHKCQTNLLDAHRNPTGKKWSKFYVKGGEE